MTASAQPGPVSVVGTNPPYIGPTNQTGGGAALVSESNPDLGPSLFWAGIGVRDPRYLARIGAGSLGVGQYPNQDCGWLWSSGGLVLTDAAPSTAAVGNIAADQAVAAGTAMTLVDGTGGAGVTKLAAALTILPTGLVVPSGALVIDSTPAYTANSFALMNTGVSLARAVSVTAAAGATGGAVVVSGYDIYGAPMSESITSVAASTVNGKKAFKFVTSATPAFTDAGHNYSVGTADIFGLHIRADYAAYTKIFWDGALNSGTFTAADTTSPATTTTGDVRGTTVPASGSDGTKRLVVMVGPSVGNAAGVSYATVRTGLLGVLQNLQS